MKKEQGLAALKAEWILEAVLGSAFLRFIPMMDIPDIIFCAMPNSAIQVFLELRTSVNV